ncbi:MAG TPA: hypothetical protein VJ656_00930 [Pyrinomonadaceae bacterium]|nr:hypothetical protein [Pyrinomonadaceae bacterium]
MISHIGTFDVENYATYFITAGRRGSVRMSICRTKVMTHIFYFNDTWDDEDGG